MMTIKRANEHLSLLERTNERIFLVYHSGNLRNVVIRITLEHKIAQHIPTSFLFAHVLTTLTHSNVHTF